EVPHATDFAALRPLAPVILSYILSFVYIGIYWNNHHHMLHVTTHVNGKILWANLHLLFWLSLVPVVTAWMGESRFSGLPVAAYGVVMFCAAVAYYVLSRAFIAHHGPHSQLGEAVGKDRKGVLSLVLYGAAIPLALPSPKLACGIYAAIALLWLVPDRRIERALRQH
ncbi:MAG TPA: TMEM175 family protein, partial [Steroidobacteraceae bacterium]|nr:TMEM175 family protein [Steroidobacteraceae bacterium]